MSDANTDKNSRPISRYVNSYSGVKAVVFDMDGTVMDTKVDYVALARVTEDEFVSIGVPPEVIDIDRAVQSTDHCIQWIIENKPEAVKGIDVRIGDRATAVEMENVSLAKPFPGTSELIAELRSSGYRVGILTRGGRKYMETVLSITGSSDLFEATVARDDYPHAEAKPSPKSIEHIAGKLGVKPSEVLFVGDSEVDGLTASNSGIPFIAVCTGHTDENAWKAFLGEGAVILPSIAGMIGMLPPLS